MKLKRPAKTKRYMSDQLITVRINSVMQSIDVEVESKLFKNLEIISFSTKCNLF
jgi:hypothetical protein